jgi:hypothetical protein
MASILDMNPLGAVVDVVNGVGSKLIDRLFPDKVAQAAQRDQAAAALLELQGDQAIKEMQTQLSAIIAEANSTDPWTSRARPSFMYVIYIMLLAGIPMGLVSAWNPQVALAIAAGFKAWLTAIPDSLYQLFGVGYVGYAVNRTVEKVKGAS